MKRIILTAALISTAFGMTARAGAVGGPKQRDTTVAAFSTDTFSVAFRAGEVARVMLKGDGDTDLDLYIFDENGNLVGGDDDETDACIAEFTPKWTGVFVVKVVNRGPVANKYRIVTN